jgi:hypothetical protein
MPVRVLILNLFPRLVSLFGRDAIGFVNEMNCFGVKNVFLTA